MATSLLRSLLFLLPKTFSLFDFKNILALNVPDEGYSRKASYALYMISTVLFICKALVIIVTSKIPMAILFYNMVHVEIAR